MLRNQWGRFMQSRELLPALGLRPGRHIPAEGFGPTIVGGTIFCCEPAGRNRRLHRIFYRCEACERWLPFGRAGQHEKGREHRLNFALVHGQP